MKTRNKVAIIYRPFKKIFCLSWWQGEQQMLQGAVSADTMLFSDVGQLFFMAGQLLIAIPTYFLVRTFNTNHWRCELYMYWYWYVITEVILKKKLKKKKEKMRLSLLVIFSHNSINMMKLTDDKFCTLRKIHRSQIDIVI